MMDEVKTKSALNIFSFLNCCPNPSSPRRAYDIHRRMNISMHHCHNTLLSKNMQNVVYIWHVYCISLNFLADVGKFFATNAIAALFRSYEDIFIVPKSDHFDYHFLHHVYNWEHLILERKTFKSISTNPGGEIVAMWATSYG